MKAQVEQLAEMSETLESAGFSRPKSNAVIESVALAMETFAVTPELLDTRIDGLREEMNARFASQDEEIKGLRQSVDRLERAMHELRQDMIAFQNTMARYMTVFTVLMLGAVAGVFGTIAGRLFV